MNRAGRCFGFRNSAEVERSFSREDSLQVFEDGRRQSWLDCLEKLLRETETDEKRPLGGTRRSKTAVRRSSALVKGRGESDENFPSCSDSVSPEPAFRHSRMNVVRGYGGSILRGKTRASETQTSRSHSGNSYLAFSRTKGSRDWRTENKRKFPTVRKISNDAGDPLPRRGTPAGDNCRCYSNAGLKKGPGNYRRTRSYPKNFVITTASTSDEEIIDYQVPIESALAFNRLADTGSGTKTLVPTSSHVTIRICSRNSNSSIRCDESYDGKHDRGGFEERVRRGLKPTCWCDHTGDNDLPDKLEPSFKPGCPPETECRPNSSNKFASRSGRGTCRCCKCSKTSCPMIDFDESGEQGSFERFKDVLSETHGPGKRLVRETSQESVPKSGRTMCEPKRPRRVVRKGLPGAGINTRKKMPTNGDCREVRDLPPVPLSARSYKEFCDRCERIRKSTWNMNRDDAEDVQVAQAWKGDGFILRDLTPDLPPLDHWSQYDDGMRKVADEYRALKSCVNFVEGEDEDEEKSSRCWTEKSVTRSYPSGTEFTFGVKRVPERRRRGACQNSFTEGDRESTSTRRDEKYRGTGRSVCFEENEREEQSRFCDCPEEAGPGNNDCRIEDMKTREADLVKTLETFCEKMKSMKTEFEKSSAGGFLKENGRCRSCGRGADGTGNKMKAKKLLIFPPQGENGPPLTLYKNSSSVNCRVKGDPETGFRYNVIYIQRFVSSTWNPDKKACECRVDSG